MRALAEFIMRGRVQAAVVALIGTWFPLISPATVAFVSLRRGAQDGTHVLVWALLPAVVSLFLSEYGPMMAYITLAAITATYAVSLLLRATRSWSYAMVGLVALSTASALLLTVFESSPAEALVKVVGNILSQDASIASKGALAFEPTDTLVLGFIAYVMAWNSLLSLFLGRWWQALLYNPGGFQTEFHGLRLNASQAIVCLLSALYCLSVGGDYQVWGSLFALPLFISGLGLVHSCIKQLAIRRGWLVMFYLALMLFSPMLLVLYSPLMVMLTVVAFMDTWINFRARIKPRV